MRLFVSFVLIFLICGLQAQVFVEKQTRYRFAQTTIGLDLQRSQNGQSFFLDNDERIQSVSLPSVTKPRLIIGGTHFWGHADFYIAIPLTFPRAQTNNQEIFYTSGVETVFKYYPWKIKSDRIRPFVGLSLTPYFFQHDNNNQTFSSGQGLTHTSVPFVTGVTWAKGPHLVEVSTTWNYNNNQPYFISRAIESDIETPPIFLSIAYKWMVDTTLGAEENWENGKTKKAIDALGGAGKLDGWFLGVGLSSAWWLGESSYNETNYPFVSDYGISLLPDFAAGYYFYKADINMALSYRPYGATINSYGLSQTLKRRSLGFEVTKYLFDYHGFDPFIGPVLSWERLSFQQNDQGTNQQDVKRDLIAYGLTFGWDIRPDRAQSLILRTNLRWFPNLDLTVEQNQKISFKNIEFNFIQIIVFPNRW